MRAGLIQASASENLQENLKRTTSLLKEAAEQGAELVCLQECFNTWFFAQRINPDDQALAEPLDGPSITHIRDAAARHKLHVIAPFYEKAMSGELYNAAVLIDDSGNILGNYRKHHLPMSSHFNEKFYFRPGNIGFPVFETSLGKIGIMICYDRHFPEAARMLGLAGAEYIFVPTATTKRGFSRSVWETELKAHAIANGYYVAGVNRVGTELESEYYGASVFVDPIGEVIAQAGDKETVLVVDLPHERIDEVRRIWPFLRDRRPDAYGEIIAP